MSTKPDPDRDALIREISRYLAAVDVFRAERCAPTWLPERTSDVEAVAPTDAPPVRSAH